MLTSLCVGSQRPHTPLLEGSQKVSTIICRRCQEESLFGGVLGDQESVVSSTGYNRKGNTEGGILNLGSVHKPNREEGKDCYAIANVLAPPERRASGQAQLSEQPPTHLGSQCRQQKLPNLTKVHKLLLEGSTNSQIKFMMP